MPRLTLTINPSRQMRSKEHGVTVEVTPSVAFGDTRNIGPMFLQPSRDPGCRSVDNTVVSRNTPEGLRDVPLVTVGVLFCD